MDRRYLGLALLLGLVHGLIYLFLLPPWQHYDEPNHFEYVWLLAHKSGFPKPGDYDKTMRRQVAESLIRHDFFKDFGFIPDPESAEPAWIGAYPQLDQPPAYYSLASIPLRLLHIEAIDTQLYMARLISLALFLFTIFCAWGMMQEITRPGNPLRWMAPVSVALLPGLADLMTAVNNDVAAVATVSFFLWGLLRIVENGLSLVNLLWMIVGAGLCIFSKSTAYLVLPLVVPALLFGIFPRRRWIAWISLAGIGVAGIALMIGWGDAAWWARASSQVSDTRVALDSAPLGNHAFALEISPEKINNHTQLQQIIPREIAFRMAGQPYTIAGWIWASQPVQAQLPSLHLFLEKEEVFTQQQDLRTTPQYFSFTITPTINTNRAWISLAPLQDGVSPSIVIYYDGLVLAKGAYPATSRPVFSEKNGETGRWNGEPFENILRNASAEYSWLRFYPWVDHLGGRLFRDVGSTSPSRAFYTMIDWRGSGWYYKAAGSIMLRTFWAHFGWGHVPLIGHKPYRYLALITGIGLMGAVVALILHRKRLPWEALAIVAMALAIVWGIAWMRGSNYLFQARRVYFPVARYAYPVVIPTLMILIGGWLQIAQLFERWLKFPLWVKDVVYWIFWVALDLWSIVSIYKYYYG